MGASLLLERGGKTLKVVPLEGELIQIGRVMGNDIVLNEEDVSKRHAQLRPEGQVYVIEDLNSTNGTFVNGTPITKHLLRSGDAIRIGTYMMKYLEEEQGDDEMADDKTRVMPQGGSGMRSQDTGSSPQHGGSVHKGTEIFQAPIATTGAKFVVTSGSKRGQEFPLWGGLKIGRDPSSDVPLSDDGAVSSTHALIAVEGDAITVIDQNSKNHIFVNGRQEYSRRLAHGDTVMVGKTTLRFVDPKQEKLEAESAAKGKDVYVHVDKEKGRNWVWIPALAAVIAVVIIGMLIANRLRTPEANIPEMLTAAGQMLNSGQYDQARILYQKVIDSEPMNSTAQDGIRRTKDYERAAELLSSAQAGWRKDIAASLDQVSIALRLDPGSRAAADLQARLTSIQDDINRATALVQSERLAAAKEFIGELQADYPEERQVMNLAGLLESKEPTPPPASPAVVEVRRPPPPREPVSTEPRPATPVSGDFVKEAWDRFHEWNFDAARGRANLAIAAGLRPDEARTILSLVALGERAERQFADGDCKAAIDTYDRLLATDPTCIRAKLLREEVVNADQAGQCGRGAFRGARVPDAVAQPTASTAVDDEKAKQLFNSALTMLDSPGYDKVEYRRQLEEALKYAAKDGDAYRLINARLQAAK